MGYTNSYEYANIYANSLHSKFLVTAAAWLPLRVRMFHMNFFFLNESVSFSHRPPPPLETGSHICSFDWTQTQSSAYPCLPDCSVWKPRGRTSTMVYEVS